MINWALAFENANAKYNAEHPVVVVNAGITYKGVEYSTETITTMRDWVKDCQWNDLDADDIDELTPFEILKGIEQNYDGGIKAFINA